MDGIIKRREGRGGWTLVEMLVVMVVMVIIMAIGVPAFIGIGRGTGMQSAVSSVQSSLTLARQWAITRKERVAFFCVEGVAGSATNPSYCFATNEFGDTIQNPTELPRGVHFHNDERIVFASDGGLVPPTFSPSILIEEMQIHSTNSIKVYGITGGIRVQ